MYSVVYALSSPLFSFKIAIVQPFIPLELLWLLLTSYNSASITGKLVPVRYSIPLVGNPCKTSPGKSYNLPPM